MGKRKLPDFETARHLYEDEHMSLAEICTMYGCSLSSQGALSALLRGGGVDVRSKSQYLKERTQDQPKLGRPPANSYQAEGQVTFGSMEYAAEPRRVQPPQKEPVRAYAQPGDNAAYIEHNMTMFHWPKINFKDPDEVEDRVLQYFRHCYDDDMKPSVAGMALALGIDRRRLWEMAQQESVRVVGIETVPESREIIKRAYTVLTSQMEDYMQNGKIHPVAGIWLMKNNMDYKDSSELTITANSAMREPERIIDIQQKYGMLPEE